MTRKGLTCTALTGLVLGVAGLGAAAASAAHQAPAGRADVGRAGGAIFIHATGNDGPKATIVIVGAIGDHGTTVQMDKNGKPDPNGNFVKVSLKKGTFEVDSTALNTAQGRPTILNKSTCSMLFRGTAPVTFFNGTGSYTGIKGKATITFEYGFVAPSTAGGKCNMSESAKPLAAWDLVNGPGTVAFG
jgi:hypothetical protein